MSQHRTPRLPSRVLLALEGLDWEWKRGAKHWRLIVDGHQVLICGNKFEAGDIRSTQNAIGHIRLYRRKLAA